MNLLFLLWSLASGASAECMFQTRVQHLKTNFFIEHDPKTLAHFFICYLPNKQQRDPTEGRSPECVPVSNPGPFYRMVTTCFKPVWCTPYSWRQKEDPGEMWLHYWLVTGLPRCMHLACQPFPFLPPVNQPSLSPRGTKRHWLFVWLVPHLRYIISMPICKEAMKGHKDSPKLGKWRQH